MIPPGGILPIKLSLCHKHRNWICWFMGFYNQETIHQKLKSCDFVFFLKRATSPTFPGAPPVIPFRPPKRDPFRRAALWASRT